MNKPDIKALILKLLQELGACPAIPFFEAGVASAIGQVLDSLGLPVQRDIYGNLRAHLSGHDSSQPAIAFVAHMDHPGLEALRPSAEGLRQEGDLVIARAQGGVPAACFSERVPVQLMLPDRGRLKGETAGRYGEEQERLVAVRVEDARRLALPCAVVFDLPDFSLDGDLVRMRALDDLAGCASILAALHRLAAERAPGPVYGVFTRAEEVGLIGARLMARDRWLPPDTLVVSVEASRTLPGAAIGEGPVIRVGDATLTFDAEAEGALVRARELLLERQPGFKVQRQLMSGGTCEASAFAFHGYRATGIALPLGNYHNAAPGGGVAAEEVHLDDFVGAVELMAQAARSVPQRREGPGWRRLREVPEDYQRRLQDTASG